VVVTPFGDLDLEDEIAYRRWEDAHARRHRVYTQLTGTVGGQTVRGHIDADWMHRHWAKHVALATYAGLDLSQLGLQGLALPHRWRTTDELHQWHELHNRVHLKIDQQLQL
jgi:hypothetical protein